MYVLQTTVAGVTQDMHMDGVMTRRVMRGVFGRSSSVRWCFLTWDGELYS